MLNFKNIIVGEYRGQIWANGHHDKIDVFDELCKWISYRIRPSKIIYKIHSSYGLKHIFESDTGIYVDNVEFKMVMGKFYIKNELFKDGRKLKRTEQEISDDILNPIKNVYYYIKHIEDAGLKFNINIS